MRIQPMDAVFQVLAALTTGPAPVSLWGQGVKSIAYAADGDVTIETLEPVVVTGAGPQSLIFVSPGGAPQVVEVDIIDATHLQIRTRNSGTGALEPGGVNLMLLTHPLPLVDTDS
jgi:hypothetical protein